jgi:hypothetical protein
MQLKYLYLYIYININTMLTLNNHDQLDSLDSNVQYDVHDGKYLEFKSPYVSGIVTYDSVTDIFTINGKTPLTESIKYLAASPLMRGYSYSGSALPFPNYESAYENTPNQGTVPVVGGEFTIKILHPSEYYTTQGKILMKPHIHFKFPDMNKLVTIVIGDIIPNRSLTGLPDHPNRTIGR